MRTKPGVGRIAGAVGVVVLLAFGSACTKESSSTEPPDDEESSQEEPFPEGQTFDVTDKTKATCIILDAPENVSPGEDLIRRLIEITEGKPADELDDSFELVRVGAPEALEAPVKVLLGAVTEAVTTGSPAATTPELDAAIDEIDTWVDAECAGVVDDGAETS